MTSTGPILLTSFQTWKSYQTSNASDDLLAALQAQGRLPKNSRWARNLPVCFDLAPRQVIQTIHAVKPPMVVCCGMAESRAYLSIEQQARLGNKKQQTSVNLRQVIYRTRLSRISYDAGSYVCNHLYYRVLLEASQLPWNTAVVFAHIPVLRPGTQRFILSDFSKILNKLAQQAA